MGMRLTLIIFVLLAGAASQLAGYHVRKEATVMRSLERDVTQKRAHLARLRLHEQHLRRHSRIQTWASHLTGFGPASSAMRRPGLRQAIVPHPRARPAHAPSMANLASAKAEVLAKKPRETGQFDEAQALAVLEQAL